MHLWRRQHVYETLRRVPRDSTDEFDDLYFGPGGQLIDVEDQDNTGAGVVASTDPAVAGEASQTFGFDLQPSSALLSPLAATSTLASYPVSNISSMNILSLTLSGR